MYKIRPDSFIYEITVSGTLAKYLQIRVTLSKKVVFQLTFQEVHRMALQSLRDESMIAFVLPSQAI